MIEAWQLVLLFPGDSIGTVIQSLDIDSRIKNIKNAMLSDELLTVDKFSHPDIIRLFTKWKIYLTSEKEPHSKADNSYEDVKKSFLNCFGATWWDNWLRYTWYFYRTSDLLKRGIYADSNDADKN